MKIKDIEELQKTYGENATLSDVKIQMMGNKIYKCPKCDGTGVLKIKYNAYPSGLPDSGWVEDWKYKDKECDLCNGFGYTSHEYKPKMVQDGWE